MSIEKLIKKHSKWQSIYCEVRVQYVEHWDKHRMAKSKRENSPLCSFFVASLLFHFLFLIQRNALRNWLLTNMSNCTDPFLHLCTVYIPKVKLVAEMG